MTISDYEKWKRFEFSAVGGLVNPDSHKECGAIDRDAKFLEPRHWGGCTTCYKIIRQMYIDRREPEKLKAPAEQMELFGIEKQSAVNDEL